MKYHFFSTGIVCLICFFVLFAPSSSAVNGTPAVERIVILNEDGTPLVSPGSIPVLRVGQSVKLSVKVYPDSIQNPVIDWFCSDEGTAVIVERNPDGTAVLTCVSAVPGWLTVTVRCNGISQNESILLREANENGYIKKETTTRMPEPLVNPVKLSEAGIEDISIGDYVLFGEYEQDAILNDGSEALEWHVLDIQGTNVLLVNRFVIEKIHYDNYSITESAAWEECSLREWLNTEFVNEAFSSQERAMIVRCSATEERKSVLEATVSESVFLLTADDLEIYMPDKTDRLCQYTLYSDPSFPRQYAYWWILVPGENHYYPGVVDTYGEVIEVMFGYDMGVRPALWVNLQKQ